MEEALQIEDIQGHIFPGFGTTYTVVIGLQSRDPSQASDARSALGKLVPQVTTMAASLREKEIRRDAILQGLSRPAQSNPSLAMAFSSGLLREWGYDTSRFDLSFHEGMRADAAALKDPLDANGKPLDWKFNTGNEDRVDVLLVAGHSDLTELENAIEGWQDAVGAYFTTIWTECGTRRTDDKEFFGFNDGISQPALRGKTPGGEPVSRRTIVAEDPRSNLFARPGQLLIWPGTFFFGYLQQGMDLAIPGPTMLPPAKWMMNGSYLVWRRLRQDVSAFRNAVSTLEAELTRQGEVVPPGWTAARLVGRWPDGTPLTASPDNPDTDIGGDFLRANNFRYLATTEPTTLADSGEPPRVLPAVPADALGKGCPRVAHIRKINPRDGTSEIGQEHHPGKSMLRRGFTFGPEEEADPDADRGLMFLSYQTSIVNQFKFVQATWANSADKPTGDGLDPIVGQDGTTNTQRMLQFRGPSGQQRRCPMNGRWVIATGGEYFVAPGIAGLTTLLVDQEPD